MRLPAREGGGGGGFLEKKRIKSTISFLSVFARSFRDIFFTTRSHFTRSKTRQKDVETRREKEKGNKRKEKEGEDQGEIESEEETKDEWMNEGKADKAKEDTYSRGKDTWARV